MLVPYSSNIIFLLQRGGQTLSITGRTLVILGVSILLGLLAMATLGFILWLDCLYYCSYIKLAVTMTKYIPQVIILANVLIQATYILTLAVYCNRQRERHFLLKLCFYALTLNYIEIPINFLQQVSIYFKLRCHYEICYS